MATFEKLFKKWMKEEVIIEKWASNDGLTDTFGSPVTYQGIVIDSEDTIIKDGLISVVPGTHIFLPSTADVDYSDRVTYNGLSPQIRKIDNIKDERRRPYAVVITV
jgi:hypothetical protein